MKPLKFLFILSLFVSHWQYSIAQQGNQGRFSGNLETTANFFQRDTLIGAANTPQYDRQLFGADAWLQLNYSNYGFDLGLRFDLFNNSNLLNPQDSYSAQGVGRWYISKKINKLGISVGYLYDQIGSGIIFRAYEQRPLLIDNALYGLRTTYDLNDNWKIKAFTGRQKQQFDTYAAIIKGASIDGFVMGDSAKWSIAPGFGVTNRTLDDASMEGVVGEIANYVTADSLTPRYNSFAFSLYNTLSVGPFSWYVEGAYKTEDVFLDVFAERTLLNGEKILGRLVQRPGTVIYSSLSYAAKGFGGTLEYKRTKDFTYRATPFVELNRGIINFLPPMTRVNTYRLTARYNAATQELGEQALQLDLRYKVNKKLSFNVNFSNITNLPTVQNDGSQADAVQLYREIFTEVYYKYKRKWTITGGVQLQEYNQGIYENKFGVPNVETITPYVDFLYKISRKRSIRFEAQYMNVGDDEKAGFKQDYGDWAFALAEFTLAPHWSFVVSDMYNLGPGKLSPTDSNGEKLKIHYPRFDVFYTYKANRFSLSYVKQVEGVVCTGGICRLEPAFSGVKMTIASTF